MSDFIENAFQWKNSMYQSLVQPGLDMPVCKKHRLMSEDVRVWGWPDKQGCFSTRVIGHLVDVAYYPEHNPREIDESALSNALYELFPAEPGWGFAALDSLRKLGVKVHRGSDDMSELNLILGIEELLLNTYSRPLLREGIYSNVYFFIFNIFSELHYDCVGPVSSYAKTKRVNQFRQPFKHIK